MKNFTLNRVTVFILIILAGYWIPLMITIKWNDFTKSTFLLHSTNTATLLSNKVISPPVPKNYVSAISLVFPICDPFLDKNMCILAAPLDNLLKTAAQKQQFMYVLQKLDELQLPQTLAFIPFIESQYNPYVISSRGAAGVWQLMPDTAKNYGLLDHQRFELEASTLAALQLLKELHEQFGNWEFAVAAYNAGSKRVQHALTKKPSAKNVQELSLPPETKKYVSIFKEMKNYLK